VLFWRRPPRSVGAEALVDRYVLRLDGAKCDGHGICMLRLPQRISLDEWGFAVLDPRPLARPEDVARARRAVRACPNGALELSRDVPQS
jgi:ferredoxin